MRWVVALMTCLVCAFAAAPAFAAGEVTAFVAKKGELRLTGDDLGNEIQIDRDRETKEFVVSGRNGTTVNGAESMRFADVRSVRATMNAGDDVLALGGFRLKGFVSVDLGAGNDTFSLYHVVVLGRVVVRGGDGDDTISVLAGSDLNAGGSLKADEGANHVAITDSSVRGPMRIRSGADADLVEIHRCGFTSTASLSVRTGSGDDVVDYMGDTFQCPVETLTENGFDTVNVKTSGFAKAVGMNGGDGDDTVNVDHCTFGARFFISGGKGTNKAAMSSIVGAGFSSGGLVFAAGKGHSGNFFWAFVIVNVF